MSVEVADIYTMALVRGGLIMEAKPVTRPYAAQSLSPYAFLERKIKQRKVLEVRRLVLIYRMIGLVLLIGELHKDSRAVVAQPTH